jgi:hypothetical protein
MLIYVVYKSKWSINNIYLAGGGCVVGTADEEGTLSGKGGTPLMNDSNAGELLGEILVSFFKGGAP